MVPVRQSTRNRSLFSWREVHVKKLLAETADRAARYVTDIGKRRIAPLPEDVTRLKALGGPLPQLPSDPDSWESPVGSALEMRNITS